MKRLLVACVATVVICATPNLAQAALWEIQDAGLQDTTNFVDIGWGSGGTLNSRSDIAGNPGTRFNITLTGSGWKDILIGDNFDLPSPKSGLTAATGNSGNLSGYAGYAMTIHNPGNKAFMAALFMNTGWTDSPWSHTDRYYQNGDGSVTWVGPGATVTLTLDFTNTALWSGSAWTTGQQVQNLAYVTNVGLKVGGNPGNSGEVQSGVAFDVDVVSRSGVWEIQDAGLTDAQFKRETLWGDGTLNSKSNLVSDPGTRLNVTLSCPASGTWQNMLIGDDFKDSGMSSNVVPIGAGGMGNLSAYRFYKMTIKNPPHNPGWFMAEIFLNTGWTDPPTSEPDNYYESGWVWLAPGQSHTFAIDLAQCVNTNHVSNIGLQVGSHKGTGDYKIPCDTPFDVDVVSNVLELNVQPGSLYVQPGQNVVTDMDVKNLLQRVNACQAMLGYSSTYFNDPTGGCVAPGGGVWDLVIWDSWRDSTGTSGDIDTAIGVDAYGATGTEADGTVAMITLNASSEGTTQIVFRADVSGDDTKQTFLSDMSAQEVMPNKYDSQSIVIDGTAPTINILSAKQGGQELIGTGTNAVQGTVDIQVTASDPLAGLAGPPTVTVTPQGGSAEATTFVNESPTGTFNYTWTVTATTPNGTATINASVSDKAGNTNTDSDTFNVNKNQVGGTVSMSTLSGVSYSFNRDVGFKATDGGGSVLKTWTITVTFANNTTTQVASGSYTLTDVPGGTVNLSAKTAWSLRERQAVTFDSNKQATNNFTLLGGDINGSNSINILDYSVLKVNWYTTNAVADINGDGSVNSFDYLLMKGNWFKTGDPQ